MASRGMTATNWLGQRVGKLVVLSRGPNRVEGKSVRTYWFCRCDCGNKILARGQNLARALIGKSGGSRSCGCLRGKKIKHGKHRSSIYRIWHQMKQRCLNPKNSAYHDYGKRGITVCERWLTFENFFADMGDPPAKHSLDRIDNSLGYSKENCRWATRVQQANNRRTNVFLVFDGKRRTLAEWSEVLGVSEQCIRSRLNSGWSLDKTLSTRSSRETISRS